MTARKGIYEFLELIQSSKLVVTSEDWDKVFALASSASRSGSFGKAREYYTWKHGAHGAEAFGKGVRWFVVLREEEGVEAFKKAFTELCQLVEGNLPQPLLPVAPVQGQWRLGSGEQVFDRPDSHRHAGVSDKILTAALAAVEAKGRAFIAESVNFYFDIGKTVCVETGQGDDIVYALRPKRKGCSRFVKNKVPEDTTFCTVVLKAMQDGSHQLLTAYLGPLSAVEPWDKHATAESWEFWQTHALCWGYEETVFGTEVKLCPWR